MFGRTIKYEILRQTTAPVCCFTLLAPLELQILTKNVCSKLIEIVLKALTACSTWATHFEVVDGFTLPPATSKCRLYFASNTQIITAAVW